MPPSRYAGVPCYWLQPTGLAAVGLRRYTPEEIEPCPSGGYHNASVTTTIMFEPERYTDEQGYLLQKGVPEERVPSRRSRHWPRVCAACGKPFPRGSKWQANVHDEYLRSFAAEKVYAHHVLGVEFAGALFDTWWLKGAMGKHHDAKPGPDGIVLSAVCPNGYVWVVDAKASGGGRWTRSGDPRNPQTLTVSPSIIAGDYHGFLQHGRFTDDLGS